MRKATNTASILLAMTLLGLTGCKRLYPSTRKINTEMEAKLFFKQGTYWVYKDSLTGVMDSLYVRDAYKKVVPVPTYQDNNSERITMEIDIYRNNVKNDSMVCSMALQDNYFDFSYTNTFTNSTFGNNFRTYPFPVTHPAIVVNGITYNNVYDDTYYQLNSEVGYIRFQYQIDTAHGTTYILQRSNIIR